jgi:hypothetical protein
MQIIIKPLNVDIRTPKGCLVEYSATSSASKFPPLSVTLSKDYRSQVQVIAISDPLNAESQAEIDLAQLRKSCAQSAARWESLKLKGSTPQAFRAFLRTVNDNLSHLCQDTHSGRIRIE